jgi:hypothetical protein
MSVRNVGKPTVLPVTFKYMKKLTVEGTPAYVYNVAKPILLPVTSGSIK